MKSIGLPILLFVHSTVAAAQGPVEPRENPSPAQMKIAAAEKTIAGAADRFQSYNQLAGALVRRAEETGDPAFYSQAESALEKSFSLSPANLGGQKIRAAILLGQHRYEEALEQAKTVNALWPDDVLVYGYIADAQAALGRYSDSEEAVQWMLNLRPGNIPGMRRAAALRELFGDIDGAAEMLASELVQTAPDESADRASVLTRLAHLQLITGRLAEGERYLEQARAAFPTDLETMLELAELRRAQERAPEATRILNQLYLLSPTSDHAYRLAVALQREGQDRYAKATFGDFERKARAEMDHPQNANLDLVFYYADVSNDPAEALRLAKGEITKRQDVYTRDAYAWALSANGQDEEAYREIQAALSLGLRDARVLFHAATIAMRAHDSRAAAEYFKASLDLNPRSEWARPARQALGELSKMQAPAPGN